MEPTALGTWHLIALFLTGTYCDLFIPDLYLFLVNFFT